MISEQHQRDASRYYAFHDQIPIFRDITFGLRFYEFDHLVRRHDLLVDGVFDFKTIGNIQHAILFEPPSIDPDVEQDEGHIFAVTSTAGLDLWPVPFAEENDLACIGELLKQFLPAERVLQMLKKRGWHLRVICPASVVWGKRICWLPKDSHISTVDLLVDLPLVDGCELRASIVPFDERLSRPLECWV